ncbi:MAG: BrnT family toxin [Sphaerochaeta sp.]|nr:BrnT family toxin [Sphaerochaeta sp.]
MFEWDENKSQNNKMKHGFSFNEILDLLDDPNLLDWYDKEHSEDFEDRYHCIGCLSGFLVILVVITDNEGVIRIISARKTTPKEEEK